jgi:hypothetical protein
MMFFTDFILLSRTDNSHKKINFRAVFATKKKQITKFLCYRKRKFFLNLMMRLLFNSFIINTLSDLLLVFARIELLQDY